MVVSTSGTRLKILNILLKKGEASVGQLSSDLDLASATVRRHLDVLLRDRLVDFRQMRKQLGRPEYAYALTEQGQELLPKHYQDLLSDLLVEMSALTSQDVNGRGGKELLEILFLRMADKAAEPDADQELEARVEALRETLEQRDFIPQVESHGNTVRIELHNCPYRSVAQSVGAVCQFDKSLISNILNSPVERERCIRDGDRSCCYVATVAE